MRSYQALTHMVTIRKGLASLIESLRKDSSLSYSMEQQLTAIQSILTSLEWDIVKNGGKKSLMNSTTNTKELLNGILGSS